MNKTTRLIAISASYLKPYGKVNRSFIKCKCDCGKEVEILKKDFNNGSIRSCGCLRYDRIKEINSIHKLSKHPLYDTWRKKKGEFCLIWQNDILNFYSWCINNGWKKGLRITKINSNLDYGPNNCKFLTRAEWNREKLSYFYNGKNLTEWATETGFCLSSIQKRVKKYGYNKAIEMNRCMTDIEHVMMNLLKNIDVKYQHEFTIDNKRADFFLPDYNLIIEVNGLYWHSDAILKDKNYHKNKKEIYTRNGYTSLFFNEDEILYKLDIVKSIILNKINKSIRIFARKCKIVEINESSFFEENHLMGKGRGKIYGLDFNGIKTAIQVIQKNGLEISRFCHKNGYIVIGGYSKLLKYIENKFNPKQISTFVDCRYGNGEYLNKLGFILKNNNLSFKWVKGCQSLHRMKYLSNSGYQYGFHKLWDCGQKLYIKQINCDVQIQ